MLTCRAESHGIHVIDTGFHREHFDAAYLLAEGGRGAFIDTGTRHSLPRLLAAIEMAGLEPAGVDWLIVTHVHLDHAGGAGALLRELPNARIVVHPRGARHMVDPSRLIEGARAVYGAAEVDRVYGEVVPVPAERVLATSDGITLELAGRPLRFLDTPGHARHHHCVWDEASRSCFAGDTFGISYREFDTAAGPWILPATTPTEFEPEAAKQSIDRLLALRPRRMYLTHFGGVGDLERLAALLVQKIDEMVRIGRSAPTGDTRDAWLRRELAALYLPALRAHGVTQADDTLLSLLTPDIELNAQGLAAWLNREARRSGRPDGNGPRIQRLFSALVAPLRPTPQARDAARSGLPLPVLELR